MKHRYFTPEHTTAVFAPSGELRADAAGFISLPADAPLGDHQALLAAKCTLAPSTESAAQPKAPSKRSSKRSGKAKAKPAADPAPAKAPEAKSEGGEAEQPKG
jgi:hypothetical protein